MAQLDFTEIAAASVPTPAAGVSSAFVDTDKRIKTKDSNGVISVLPNAGIMTLNLLQNGGLMIQQRVATAATNIPNVSTTTRAGQVADRWAVTVGNATTPQWAQIDSIGTPETGLLARYYGKIIQNTNAAKFIFSQFLSAQDIAHLRGQKVRLSVKLKQFVGSNAVYRLGLLQLAAAGTVDVCPAFISAIGAASVEPTWGTNLLAITPDAVPAGENGTITGVALSITSTAAWVRSSAVFTVPTDCKNLVFVLYRDTLGAASDACGIAELQMTQGADIVDFVAPPAEQELLACQRYFCKSFPQTVVPAASLSEATAGSGVTGLLGKTGSGTVLGSQISIQFPVPMFKAPTVTLFTPTASGAVVFRLSGTTPLSQGTTAIRTNSTTDRGCVVTATNEATTNGAVGDLVGIHYTADAEFVT